MNKLILRLSKNCDEVMCALQVHSNSDQTSTDFLQHHSGPSKRNNDIAVLPSPLNNGISLDVKMSPNETLIIVGGVIGALVFLSFFLGVLFCIRRNRRRRQSESLLSEDLVIKSSISFPSLSTGVTKDHREGAQRSRSVGTSLSSSPTDLTSSYYPQADNFEAWPTEAASDSSTSPSMTDPYSPFQRSFHVENFPNLDFSVKKNNEELTVVILKFIQLPDNVKSASESATSGIFVKVYLLPDEICQQTKIYPPSGGDEQICNEVICFKDTLSNNCLFFSTYFIDTRQVRVCLGHATVPIENEATVQRSYRVQLEELSHMLHYGVGELDLTLTFLPDRSRLAITLNSCKDLTLTDVRPTSRLMIKVELLHGRKVSAEKYFRVMKLERNPVLNETSFFKLASKRTDISHLRILLQEVTGDEPHFKDIRQVGRIDIGPYLFARGEGLLHWQTTLSNPKQPSTMSHSFEAQASS